jgi:hypothetical protein
MQASPPTTQSRLNHPRARNLLALVSALLLALLFGVSHATAAVHAKSRSHKTAASAKVRAHKRAAVHSKSKKHSKKTNVTKGSKKASTKKQPTSSSSTKTSTSTNTPVDSPTTLAPSPAITPASTPGSTQGSVLFNGTTLTSWLMNQSATSTRTQLVPDPDGQGDTVQQFTTLNTDVKPLTPTVNPRSQLVSPMTVLKAGNSYWESFEVYIPQSLTLPTKGWTSLETPVFGAPWNGSPPASIEFMNGQFRFQRNGVASNPYQIAWTAPVVKGQWYRFTWHFLLASNGWIQLYVNDVLQNLKSGSSTVTQMPISLIDATDSAGPWFSDEQLYYQLGTYQSASVYFKGFQIGTTQAAAE